MLYWPTKKEVLAIHSLQITHFGGSNGLRDEGLLESARARGKNIAAYTESTPSLARLAAAYGAGVVSNHPFVDGNKRTGLVAAFVFIERNGWRVTASQEEAYVAFYDLATGNLSEDELTAWLERNITPAQD